MKHKEARADIQELRRKIDSLPEGLSVKKCKHCKDKTLHQTELRYTGGMWGCRYKTGDRCLTCGKLWEQQTVCKEVKE